MVLPLLPPINRDFLDPYRLSNNNQKLTILESVSVNFNEGVSRAIQRINRRVLLLQVGQI